MRIEHTRDFLRPLTRGSVIASLRERLLDEGASGLQETSDTVMASHLRVFGAGAADYDLSDIRFVVEGDETARKLAIAADAKVHYSPAYTARLSVPIVLAAGFAYTVSPLVLLALPVGYLLIRLSHKTELPIWFEEFAYSLEKAANVAASRDDA